MQTIVVECVNNNDAELALEYFEDVRQLAGSIYNGMSNKPEHFVPFRDTMRLLLDFILNTKNTVELVTNFIKNKFKKSTNIGKVILWSNEAESDAMVLIFAAKVSAELKSAPLATLVYEAAKNSNIKVGQGILSFTISAWKTLSNEHGSFHFDITDL